MTNPAAGTPTTPPAAATPAPQLPPINPPLGMDGYCPVSLSETQRWVLGDRRWGAIHRERTYLFAGPEQQRRFFADPDRYAPAASGNDVVLATEQGQAVPGMRQHGVSFGNHVYLFSSEATLEKFSKNPNIYVNQALGSLRAGASGGQQMR
jgi:YHS domain-containing protein